MKFFKGSLFSLCFLSSAVAFASEPLKFGFKGQSVNVGGEEVSGECTLEIVKDGDKIINLKLVGEGVLKGFFPNRVVTEVLIDLANPPVRYVAETKITSKEATSEGIEVIGENALTYKEATHPVEETIRGHQKIVVKGLHPEGEGVASVVGKTWNGYGLGLVKVTQQEVKCVNLMRVH
jgi:hypothetical protein